MRVAAVHGSAPALGAAQPIERVTAYDGILAGDAIKMVSQRGDSIKKGFMVRMLSSMQAPSSSTNLDSGHQKSPIFD
jgi:hypothetical protein